MIHCIFFYYTEEKLMKMSRYLSRGRSKPSPSLKVDTQLLDRGIVTWDIYKSSGKQKL